MLCRKRGAETEEAAVLNGREEDFGDEGTLANGPLGADGERTLGQRLEALQLQARAVRLLRPDLCARGLAWKALVCSMSQHYRLAYQRLGRGMKRVWAVICTSSSDTDHSFLGPIPLSCLAVLTVTLRVSQTFSDKQNKQSKLLA